MHLDDMPLYHLWNQTNYDEVDHKIRTIFFRTHLKHATFESLDMLDYVKEHRL